MKKLIPLTSLLLLGSLAVSAQDKLKDVQIAGLRAPAVVKVNGDLSEWNDSFQAYNKSTKLFYTISNDDKNIYIAIKSTDAINNNKITAGGITLTFNTDGKKKEKDAYNLTFPVIVRPTRRVQGGAPGGFAGGGSGNVMVFRSGGGGDMPGGRAPVDSAMIKAAHERTIAAAKEIKLFGFKDIPDSLISVYNEYGIKAAIGYDAKGNFTYEFALPIKLLNLSTDNPKEIAYNVKVNGLQIPNMMMRMNDEGGGGNGGPGGGGFGGPGGGPGGGRAMVIMGGPGGGPGGGGPNTFQEMTSPSDFWGKYTLAKK